MGHTRIYLIRHGETDWNRDGICMGQADVALNDLGYRQARLIAERFSSIGIDWVYASDLARAVETARPLTEQQGLEVQLIEGLREQHWGDWQGLKREEIEIRLPEAFEGDPPGDPRRFHPPGGERALEFYGRSVRVFEHLLEAHRGQSVAVVTHGGVIRCVINSVLGRTTRPPQGDFFSLGFAVDNGSVSLVRAIDGGMPEIAYLNSTCHLDSSAPSPSE